MSVDVGPSVKDELRAEQEYFDDAHEAREEKRRSCLDAPKAAGDSKAAACLANGGRHLGPPGQAVAFAKVVADDGTCYYVGQQHISLNAVTYVYSWKAPAIMKMREATALEPRGVERQRRFHTDGNVVVSFDDQVFATLSRALQHSDDPGTTVIRSDAMLAAELSRDRSQQMHQIAQTIQAAQSRVVRTPLDRLLIVQGGPGTGKTAVALHRVSYLLHRHVEDLSPSDLLFVGPNPTFVQYINRVLPELGDEQVRQADVLGMLSSPVRVRAEDEPGVARLKGDARMAKVLARAVSQRVKPRAEPVTIESASHAGVRARISVHQHEVSQCCRALQADHGVLYVRGRKIFRQRLVELVERKLADSVRLSGRTFLARSLAADPAHITGLVDRTWPLLSAPAFIRSLLGSRDQMRSATAGILTAAQAATLHCASAQSLADEPWTREDVVLIDAARALIDGPPRTFRHVVVDEAQDLSPMHLLALRRRSVDGSMTVVGDIAQSTGLWARDSWDDVRALLSSDLEAVEADLPHGYRVPRSVMEMAARLLPEAAPGITAPVVIRDVEPGPRLVPVPVDRDFFEAAVSAVRDHSSTGRFVGVVCPDERLGGLARALDAARISYRRAADGGLGTSVTLVSPVAAKGLEFDAVVVIDPQAIVEGDSRGHRMLYIALTRTTRYLDVVYPEGSLPALIQPETGPASIGASPVPLVWQVSPTRAKPAPAPPAPPIRTRAVPALPVTASVVPAPGAAASPARRKAVDAHVDMLLEHLDEFVTPRLWQEVLVEAQRRLADATTP